MSLLRFDPAGVINDDFGVTKAQFAAFAEPLVTLRRELIPDNDPAFTSTFRQPEKRLTDYEAFREKSELGRVFRVANRLHDHLDAVVVIGEPSALLAPTTLMQACCEPYHNELCRSARGSKPRMYFTTSLIDNDAVEGLLRRLATGRGSTGNPALSRYAVIAIDSGCDEASSLATAVSLRLLGEQLAESLSEFIGDTDNRWLAKLIISITPETGPVRACAERLGGAAAFPFEHDEGGPFGMHSAANLLPAALLGLDCMQLLVGAAAMNEHFLTASFAENIVMQHVAANLALAHHRDRSAGTWQIWPPALSGLGPWLQPSSAAGSAAAGSAAAVIQHLWVDTVRTDAIELQPDEAASMRGGGPIPVTTKGKKTVSAALPDLMKTAISNAQAEQNAAGQPFTSLVLPQIDTHSLGQLWQMMWLAEELNAAFQRRGFDFYPLV